MSSLSINSNRLLSPSLATRSNFGKWIFLEHVLLEFRGSESQGEYVIDGRHHQSIRCRPFWTRLCPFWTYRNGDRLVPTYPGRFNRFGENDRLFN